MNVDNDDDIVVTDNDLTNDAVVLMKPCAILALSLTHTHTG